MCFWRTLTHTSVTQCPTAFGYRAQTCFPAFCPGWDHCKPAAPGYAKRVQLTVALMNGSGVKALPVALAQVTAHGNKQSVLGNGAERDCAQRSRAVSTTRTGAQRDHPVRACWALAAGPGFFLRMKLQSLRTTSVPVARLWVTGTRSLEQDGMQAPEALTAPDSERKLRRRHLEGGLEGHITIVCMDLQIYHW